MEGSLYKLKDGFNGDVVCASDDIEEVKEAAAEYDEGCEGDWLPLFYKQDETGHYREIEDFKF